MLQTPRKELYEQTSRGIKVKQKIPMFLLYTLLYANLFNERISKAERLSNWERDVLKESQKMYAAIDAWACVKIYNELVRLKETNDYELVVVHEEPKIEYDETDIS